MLRTKMRMTTQRPKMPPACVNELPRRCAVSGRTIKQRLAAATGEQVDQTTEQAGTEAIHLHRAARVACVAAHFRENVRRQVDTKFAAGGVVVTHFRWAPRRIGSLKRGGSVLKHARGMMCRGSQCYQCRKTRTSLCKCLIVV